MEYIAMESLPYTFQREISSQIDSRVDSQNAFTHMEATEVHFNSPRASARANPRASPKGSPRLESAVSRSYRKECYSVDERVHNRTQIIPNEESQGISLDINNRNGTNVDQTGIENLKINIIAKLDLNVEDEVSEFLLDADMINLHVQSDSDSELEVLGMIVEATEQFQNITVLQHQNHFDRSQSHDPIRLPRPQEDSQVTPPICFRRLRTA